MIRARLLLTPPAFALGAVVVAAAVGLFLMRGGSAASTGCPQLERLFSERSLFGEEAAPSSALELEASLAVAREAAAELGVNESTSEAGATLSGELDDLEKLFTEHGFELQAVYSDPRVETVHAPGGPLDEALASLHQRWQAGCDG